MLIKLLLLSAALGCGLFSTESSAQIFDLEYTPAGGMDPNVVAAFRAEVQKVEDEINAGLPSANSPDRLMEGMANSSVMAGKGIGSDYASGMEVMLIGAGVGVGADLEKNKEADADISGVGVQGGLILGTNLAWMDTQKILGLETNKLNLYLNFMKYDMEQKTGDTKATFDSTSMGFHVSYDWKKGSSNKLLGWGGIKIHTGYEYNKTELNFTSTINETVSQTPVAGTTYSSTVVANPFAAINVNTHSIPLEISTSLRFLYLFSLYGGLGADYSTGTATGKGDLNSDSAPVTCTTTTASCSPGPGSGPAGTIETSANIDGKGKANPFLFRGFAGLQINLPFVRIFVQGDKAFGNELVGATAGVRFVY